MTGGKSMKRNWDAEMILKSLAPDEELYKKEQEEKEKRPNKTMVSL